MSIMNWQSTWQQTKANPEARCVIALMLLNGFTAEHIQEIAVSRSDIQAGWLVTDGGFTLPLVTQAQEALLVLPDFTAALPLLRTTAQQFASLEAEAHRLLAGAIWVTDDTHRLMLETIGSVEAPILPLRYTFPISVGERLQPGEDSAVANQARRTLQTAADWLMEQTLTTGISLTGRIFGLLRQGSLFFLLASTAVSGLNLVHNILMGRLLSPADYSQLTFIITLQLLIGLLPGALQTVVARFSARYQANDQAQLRRALAHSAGRLGWMFGVGLAGLLLLLSPLLIATFQLSGVGVLLPVILAIPFFVRTGIDRGLLQGLGGYFWLSAAYIVEGLVRLGVGVLLGYALLAAGYSLEGAVWGLAQSMAITWLISWLALRHDTSRHAPLVSADADERRGWLRLAALSGLVLVGQALITNSDFLLVKNFFTPDEAGLYAAVSVLGRIVYFGALPLTILLVPLIARRQALSQPTQPILLMLIGGGTAVCMLLIGGAALFAEDILRLLYGDAYAAAAHLLAPYALAASLYTLTNLAIMYQIALGRGGETWMPILAGTLQIVGVVLFHETLSQVIGVQITLMSLLLAAVLWRTLPVNHAINPLPDSAANPALEGAG